MSANARLRIVALVIIVSAVYAVVIAKDPQTASAIATGYIALLVTAWFLVTFKKKT